MFLFILESIGMQELILIGAIALIVFGPRKLPQLMKTAGKMMAEFRKATNDFKETWEREVDFEDVKEPVAVKNVSPIENTIGKHEDSVPQQIAPPEIKEVKQEDLEKIFPQKEEVKQPLENLTNSAAGKQNWL